MELKHKQEWQVSLRLWCHIRKRESEACNIKHTSVSYKGSLRYFEKNIRTLFINEGSIFLCTMEQFPTTH